MYKHILVPATGADSDSAVFATALCAARPAGAHLEFLHVKADVTRVLMAITAGGLGAAVIVQDVLDKMEAEIEASQRKAWDRYTAFCAAESIAAASGSRVV